MDVLCRLDGDSRLPVRLVFFPHAGGGITGYSRFLASLADIAEIWAWQAPGRERRAHQKPIAALSRLVNLANAQLSTLGTTPTMLFGISFGALVAHEIARLASKNALCRTIRRLIVASAPGPCRHARFPPLMYLPSSRMLEAVAARYGSLGPDALQNKEFVRLVAPALRADLAMWESYVPPPNSSIPIPLRIWAGNDDVYSHEDFQAWALHYPAAGTVTYFPGNHFFIQQCQPAVVDALRRELVEVASLQAADHHAPVAPDAGSG
jgi:medium-chain acyl-[acyl-carrier-protein] hydrolase